MIQLYDVNGAPLPPVELSAFNHTVAVIAVGVACAVLVILWAMINMPPQDPRRPKKRWFEYLDQTDGGRLPPPRFL